MELENIQHEYRADENIDAKQVGVSVKGLSFGYTDEKVLDDVSLNIKPGEFVAIVGESRNWQNDTCKTYDVIYEPERWYN